MILWLTLFGPPLAMLLYGWLEYSRNASCDTHAKRGDVEQAPSPMGSAVPKADAQKEPPHDPR